MLSVTFPLGQFPFVTLIYRTSLAYQGSRESLSGTVSTPLLLETSAFWVYWWFLCVFKDRNRNSLTQYALIWENKRASPCQGSLAWTVGGKGHSRITHSSQCCRTLGVSLLELGDIRHTPIRTSSVFRIIWALSPPACLCVLLSGSMYKSWVYPDLPSSFHSPSSAHLLLFTSLFQIQAAALLIQSWTFDSEHLSK
jgi:hypothetical protein